jgi:hypothetical protein
LSKEGDGLPRSEKFSSPAQERGISTEELQDQALVEDQEDPQPGSRRENDQLNSNTNSTFQDKKNRRNISYRGRYHSHSGYSWRIQFLHALALPFG